MIIRDIEDLNKYIRYFKASPYQILGHFKEVLEVYEEKWGEKEEFKFANISYRGYNPEQWAEKCKEETEKTKALINYYVSKSRKRLEIAKELKLINE